MSQLTNGNHVGEIAERLKSLKDRQTFCSAIGDYVYSVVRRMSNKQVQTWETELWSAMCVYKRGPADKFFVIKYPSKKLLSAVGQFSSVESRTLLLEWFNVQSESYRRELLGSTKSPQYSDWDLREGWRVHLERKSLDELREDIKVISTREEVGDSEEKVIREQLRLYLIHIFECGKARGILTAEDGRKKGMSEEYLGIFKECADSSVWSGISAS